MVAKRCATADESIEWRREHHLAHFNNARRISSIDIRWKPTLQRGLSHCRHAATLGHDYPLFLFFSGGRGGCSSHLANDHRVDAIRIYFSKTERGRTAE